MVDIIVSNNACITGREYPCNSLFLITRNTETPMNTIIEFDVMISSYLVRPRILFLKKLNRKIMSKMEQRMIPSVHISVLDSCGIFSKTHNRQSQIWINGVLNRRGRIKSKFINCVKFLWLRTHHSYTIYNQAFWYYYDGVTHPNIPHKQLRRHGTTTVKGLCLKMWESNDFSAMPILADALEDQDFPDHYYLKHLRVFEHFSRANFVLQFFTNNRIGYGNEIAQPNPMPFTFVRWSTPEERQQVIDRMSTTRQVRLIHMSENTLRPTEDVNDSTTDGGLS